MILEQFYVVTICYLIKLYVLNINSYNDVVRFPEDFMFRLTQKEWNTMPSQIVTALEEVIEKQPVKTMRSQNVTA
jgi:hypothetical protein